jgi:cytochrome-b5 reductase
VKKEVAKIVATNTESPLDPKEFKEFKIKRIEPYNWNTSKYVR